jgi:two-component system chemotaxis response regulator CheB
MGLHDSSASRPGDAGAKVRVLIVDDSAFMRTALARLLRTSDRIEIIDTARNGQEGLDKTKALKPDVVTLDIEMPVLDGLSALRRIRSECTPPPAVLMCSSLTREGSHEALKALRLGAADIIAKDGSNFSMHMDAMRDDLVEKVLAIASGSARKAAASVASNVASSKPVKFRPNEFDLICIGSSTGGPPVLETLVAALPGSLTCPVLIAQHMPVMFTKSLSERLGENTPLKVRHGEDAMPVEARTIYMAPGGQHTRIVRRGTRLVLDISDEPKTAVYRPSVNELLRSAGEVGLSRVLGIVCTGMGDDGAAGAKALKATGKAFIIAQDMTSCVVYGMPKAVAQAGLADASLPPEEIARALGSLGTGSGTLAA